MSGKVRLQLSAMMFLEFFVWGSWYAFLGAYMAKLGFSGSDAGAVFSTVALGGIISPFFVGMIADRFFATERVLASMHLLGGLALWLASTVTTPTLLYWTMLLHTVCFMPTLALVNALSFHQMTDTGKEFPGIRVLGTIGWIAAGWVIGLQGLEESSATLRIGAVSSFLMAVYALTLPHTPPKSAGKKVTARDVLGLDALKLMKQRSYATFVIASLIICIPLTFYYGETATFLKDLGMENVGGKMTIGQMSEIFFLLVMPLFFVRLGLKKMLMIGMACWTLRYILFAYGNADSLVWMLYGGIVLHGVCFDFFFVSGQIYVDKKAPPELRASAQGFISFVTYGVGMFIGSYVFGYFLQQNERADGTYDWTQFWLAPAVMAGAVLIAFAVLFKDEVDTNEMSPSKSSADAKTT